MTRRSERARPRLLVDDVREDLLRRGALEGRTGAVPPLEAPVGPARVAASIASVRVLGDAGLLRASEVVRAQLSGAGPLQPLVDAPGTTDVLVNGPRSVWVDRGAGLERVQVELGDDADVRALAVRLAATAGRRLDDASPWVDARLPDGVRLHAVLAPVAVGATLISLRVPAARSLALDDLVARGGVPGEWVDVLRALVRARRSFLVTGGTGSGKTTVLGALLGLVDPSERVLVVEDATELVIEHSHVVRLQGRPGNVEGAGEVVLRDLVRQALRMRPDRLVVGEVRGQEVRDLLAALNTGHEGGCGTLHANAAADVPARLEALAALAGLDRAALAAQAASALDVVLHLRRRGQQRRLVEVGVLDRDAGGLLRVRPALTAAQDGRTLRGRSWADLQRLLDLPDLPVADGDAARSS